MNKNKFYSSTEIKVWDIVIINDFFTYDNIHKDNKSKSKYRPYIVIKKIGSNFVVIPLTHSVNYNYVHCGNYQSKIIVDDKLGNTKEIIISRKSFANTTYFYTFTLEDIKAGKVKKTFKKIYKESGYREKIMSSVNENLKIT